LLSYPDADARVGEILLDQRLMNGLGNVYRCEVLWATAISPFARVGDLSETDAIRLVNIAASLVRASLHAGSPGPATDVVDQVAVYGRNGQRCSRCGGTIDMRRMGVQQRILYWCPGCQLHLDPRISAAPEDVPVMDPHPAAQRFLADLPWNRDVV
jgi:endonuclease-8